MLRLLLAALLVMAVNCSDDEVSTNDSSIANMDLEEITETMPEMTIDDMEVVVDMESIVDMEDVVIDAELVE